MAWRLKTSKQRRKSVSGSVSGMKMAAAAAWRGSEMARNGNNISGVASAWRRRRAKSKENRARRRK
jgi:uncharacterized FlgJ-related protein